MISKHGEIIAQGPYKGCRWCAGHNSAHGPLFVCELYDNELKRQLADEADRNRANTTNPEWCAEQIAKAADKKEARTALAIMGAFFGVEAALPEVER